VTAGACARGGAIKASWAFDGDGTYFEEFVRSRLNIEERLDEVSVDDNQELWDEYGSLLDAYRQCETIILDEKN
jgi:sugar (pentulose or hexulose) kinase